MHPCNTHHKNMPVLLHQNEFLHLNCVKLPWGCHVMVTTYLWYLHAGQGSAACSAVVMNV